ncbi:hypothetical protein BCO18175_06943 [Burkholderia contaminans]|nr:hypothetical protein BCO18175_06943 [Burkholderia contaminans]
MSGLIARSDLKRGFISVRYRTIVRANLIASAFLIGGAYVLGAPLFLVDSLPL